MTSSVPTSPRPLQSEPRYRVMVCDDSAFTRSRIAHDLESDPEIEVVVSAGNGQEAIERLRDSGVEICILDLEMPVMDGLTALPLMIDIRPDLHVIVASTLTLRNAEISLRALAAGAADYVAKPSGEAAAAADFRIDLVAKVKALGAARRRTLARGALSGRGLGPGGAAQPLGAADRSVVPATPFARLGQAPAPREATNPASSAGKQGIGFDGAARPSGFALRPASTARPEIIAIGASTGGPQAIFALLGALKGALEQPIVITQHMPRSFTTIMAQHIARITGWPAVEAADRQSILPGHVYVAPGDQHLRIVRDQGLRAVLDQAPPENFCRPSVDPMLRSLAQLCGPRLLTVMLTGMGQDGLRGCEAVAEAGGSVLAQDEATSVVWGMPRAVAQAGLCCAVLPLPEIATAVIRLAG